MQICRRLKWMVPETKLKNKKTTTNHYLIFWFCVTFCQPQQKMKNGMKTHLGREGSKISRKKLMTLFMNDPSVIKRQQPKFSNKMPGMGKYTELFYYYYHAWSPPPLLLPYAPRRGCRESFFMHSELFFRSKMGVSCCSSGV